MAFLHKKWPSLNQLGQLVKILSRKEKIAFFIFLLLAMVSFIFIISSFYLKNTEPVPARGGSYIEGLVGSPRNINPVYAQTNDADRDLSELVYAGLLKYDGQGQIVNDLVKEYTVLEEGKIFEFHLKENLLWSDGQPLTAEDVVFTIKTIQNPAYKSPIRASWLGVEAEKISDLSLRFTLTNPSVVFLENLTLKIMPKHVWESINEQNFSLSIYNLKPVGSGPYKIKDIKQNKEGNIESLELITNSNYHNELPNIPKITFVFFENEEKLTAAFKSGRVDGFAPTLLEKYNRNSFVEYRLSTPRYFAVFLNPEKAKILADEKVRQALNYGTDKNQIIEQVLPGLARTVDSPILPDVYGFASPTVYEFNLDKAKEILTTAGFIEKEDNTVREKVVEKQPAFQFKSNLQVGSQSSEVQELQKCLAKDPAVYPEAETTGYFGEKTKLAVIRFQEKYKEDILTPAGLTEGTGRVLASTRAKLNELCAAPLTESSSLSFTLTTVNQENLIKVASNLKEQWKLLGVEIDIKAIDSSTLTEEAIRPRDYEMLLLGQGLEMIIDPFPFWHSSQVKDPGLNLSLYENKDADKLLERARQTLNEEERKAALEEFQSILVSQAPAIFLYSPDYLYLVSDRIKGLTAEIVTDPSKRFSQIEKWYIKTKRTWK
jgi:ABC-type transport system substrate-binding protein